MKCFLFLLATFPALAADLSDLVADRDAIERVYYNHRTGDKPPFEQTLSRNQIRELIDAAMRIEAKIT